MRPSTLAPIRLAHRRVVVTRRSQAGRGGPDNGFSTRTVRAVPAGPSDLRHGVGD